MNELKRQTLAILVDNESGVLSQISRLFSRKGFNIESLAVGATEFPETSRITIEVMADEDQARLLANQLRKLFPVHSVKLLTPETSIRRELVLYKVRTPDSAVRNGIEGRVVVEFVVDSKGKVKDIEIVRGVDEELDAQVEKVILASPKWKPARIAGREVSVRISIPVEFKLTKSPTFKIKK